MAKHWTATSLVALALLGCLVGKEVEAQDPIWQKPAPQMSKGSPPPQAPQFHQPAPLPQAPQFRQPSPPQMPKVQKPPPPQAPQFHQPAPQAPQFHQPAPLPQAPQFRQPPPPQMPKIQQPPPPQAPQFHQPAPQAPQFHQPAPLPQAPQFRQPPPPQMPKIQQPPPPQAPQFHQPAPQAPQFHQPAPLPQAPQFRQPPPPQMPKIQQPPPPQAPQFHQPAPLPQAPQFRQPSPPQMPKVQPATPPQAPQYRQPPSPQKPQVQQVSPPVYPQYPKMPQVQPPPKQNTPQNPQPPLVRPASQPQWYQPNTPSFPQPQPGWNRHSPQAPKFPAQPRAFSNFNSPQNPQEPEPYQPYDPEQPQQPKQPQQPYQPPQPKQPQQPYQPYQPPQPKQPQQPYQPYQPPQPQQPKQPQQPYQPPQPQQPKQPQQPYQPYQPPQPQQPKQPQQPYQPPQPQPQQPKRPQPKHEPLPAYQSCEVAVSQRVQCGGIDISAAECQAINCCFDGQRCYYGKAVTVQCTKDAQFIVVVARDATLPSIDLESISLLGQGQGCTHVDSNSEFAIYQFPVTACGSVVMEEPGVIIYENRMTSSYEVQVGDLGVITRDSYFEFLFQCRYIGTSVETLVVEVFPGPSPPTSVAGLGPIRVHLRLANGQCNSKGCNEVDVAYNSFYTEADYPVTKILRDPVYVEVQLLDKTDPLLVLTLGRCWTTTSHNPHSLPQWDILIDGCPYSNDRYMSSVVPYSQIYGVDFPGHYSRFFFKMFTFVDPSSMAPMKEQVYIHCSTSVCAAAPGRNCEPSCLRRKRDVTAVEEKSAEPKVVVSVGPVIMNAPEQ